MPILIAGLGNPTEQYAKTRHNAGFMILDALAQALHVSFSSRNDLHGDIAEANVNGMKVILLKPTTFMNASGDAVARTRDRYHIEHAHNVWIVYDDASIPFGTLRIRREGSSGGHNGIKSVIAHLKTMDFTRFRFGIGEPIKPMALEDWVLAKFSQEEQNALTKIIQRAAEHVKHAITTDTQDVTYQLHD